MPIPVNPMPDVVLLFQGLLVMFLKEGERQCRVGILRSALEHDFLLEIRKCTPQGLEPPIRKLTKPMLKPDLSLVVENTTKDRVEFYTRGDFDRKGTDNDLCDFRWVVDFEGREVYDEKVLIDPLGLISTLPITGHALFLTLRQSDDELIVIRGEGDEDTIGRVAIRVAAFIYLDRRDSVAVFTNDGESCNIQREDGVVHRILVSESRPPGASTGHHNDSVLYSQAIVGGMASGKRIHFDSTMLRDPDLQARQSSQGQQYNQGDQEQPTITGIDFLDLVLTKGLPFADPMAVCLNAQLGRR